MFTFVYSLAQRRYDQMVTRPHHYDSKLLLTDLTEAKRTEKCEETRHFQ